MRVRFAVLATATALIASLALAAPVAAAPPPAGAIAWVACRPSGPVLTYKPVRHLLSCADANSGLRKLSWMRWNQNTAKAEGRFYWNECDPSCSEGTTLRSDATVTLRRPRMQHGVRVFTRVVIHYTDGDGHPAIQREDALSWPGSS